MVSWNTAKNILCVRLDTIGDVIMTVPALRKLKHALPDRRLTLMTSAAGATITPLIPDLDDVIVYDAPWLKATEPRSNSTPEFTMIEKLRQFQFDAVVIFTVYSQNPLPAAFLAYLADIPLRLAHCHENPYQLLTHWVKDPEPEQVIRHEVRRQLDLVASISCAAETEAEQSDRPFLQISETAQQQVRAILVQAGINLSQPWIVIHPGATAPSRRYPPESFAIVARALAEAGIQLVFTGTQPEVELVQSIQDKMQVPSHSLVDRLSLAELTALLSLSSLLISNNTGPVHIASAIGTPVVDLYALTNLQHTPWNVPHHVLFHDVPCRLCYKSICPEAHHHCLRLVEPNTVVKAALDLLAETRSMPPRSSSLAIPANIQSHRNSIAELPLSISPSSHLPILIP